ncbi:MAG TPA: RDD family protein [Actinomycetes bacterium]
MSQQGYGPTDPEQTGQEQPPPQPSYPPPPAGYGPPPPAYGEAPGGYAQIEPPGWYMGHKLANWPQRVGAYLIDLLLVTVPLGIGVGLFTPNSNGTVPGGRTLAGTLLCLVAFGAWIYNRCILAGRTGQSLGKQALGLKLLRMDNGHPIGGLMAAGRDLLHFLIDGLLCDLGYLWPIWDNRRQTFADKIVSTVVIAD